MSEAISRRQLFKREFHVLRADVSAAIAAADPIGLFALGAPCDEYDREVDLIVAGVARARDADDVQRVVHEAFVRSFGAETAGTRDRYQTATATIWEAVLKSRRK